MCTIILRINDCIWLYTMECYCVSKWNAIVAKNLVLFANAPDFYSVENINKVEKEIKEECIN